MAFVRANQANWQNEEYKREFVTVLDLYLETALSDIETNRNLQLYFTADFVSSLTKKVVDQTRDLLQHWAIIEPIDGKTPRLANKFTAEMTE